MWSGRFRGVRLRRDGWPRRGRLCYGCEVPIRWAIERTGKVSIGKAPPTADRQTDGRQVNNQAAGCCRFVSAEVFRFSTLVCYNAYASPPPI